MLTFNGIPIHLSTDNPFMLDASKGRPSPDRDGKAMPDVIDSLLRNGCDDRLGNGTESWPSSMTKWTFSWALFQVGSMPMGGKSQIFLILEVITCGGINDPPVDDKHQ